MDNHGLSNNPFATLTRNAEQPLKKPIAETCSPGSPENVAQEAKHVTEVDSLLERVFLLTLDKEPFHERVPKCVFLEELHQGLAQQTWIGTSTLGQALFERLMLDSPVDHVIVTSQRSDPQSARDVAEPDPLRYLFQCYSRLSQQTPVKPDLRDVCQSAIIANAKLGFQHSELFPTLNIPAQFTSIFTDSPEIATDFFSKVAVAIDGEREEGTVLECFRPIFDSLKVSVNDDLSLSRSSNVFQCLDILLFFAQHSLLAEALIRYNEPAARSTGRAYEATLLGAILSISCVPKVETGPYEFFDQPSRYSKQDHDITESNIHRPLGGLTERMHQVFYSLLRHKGESRQRTLTWLGQCLHANRDRAKLWSSQNPLLVSTLCSDGFALNLCTVLLRLCQPFAQPDSLKMLKVHPTYCIATLGDPGQLSDRGVHLTDLSDTPLIPVSSQQVAPAVEASYNFMTDIYFMCHYSFSLSFRVMHEKLLKMNQHLHRMQGIIQDVSHMPGPEAERIKEQMEKGMTRMLCVKTALTQSQMLELCFDFIIASARWLIQVATSSDFSGFQPVTFPLSKKVPEVLACVPEFIAENIIDFLLFLRRFKESLFQFAGEKLEHMMSFVLVFMGSPDRMNNPHLRAKLAEALEFLKPPEKTSATSAMSTSERETLFRKHPLAAHVGETLLHVFVSIEMTGQGVEFEQKFNYRRPMYAVLRYIWTMKLHRDALMRLAVDAEEHIEATDPPLFLRFINLLMNDAIFLLDEALSYMAQIKEKQEEQERGDWERLSPAQRQETENEFHHLSMLARFHNIMGSETIQCLEMLTKQIKTIFCHPMIVDRMAAMLNYFLLHLVGPKKKILKVKDFTEFEFKPQQLVSYISAIYVNLGDTDAFCVAVSRDGRSYSQSLFELAEVVLNKIYTPVEMIEHFNRVAAHIQTLSVQQQSEDDLVADAPEEFLDAIMGTLMRDPVTLPSSGQTVDRSTIARHILSDQTDPFNRQPLTMDMVIPATDLHLRTEQWLREKKQQQH